MPALDWQVVEERTRRLGDAGLLEQRENVRPATSPDGYDPQEGQEDTPCNRAIRSVPVRGVPASLRTSLAGLL